MIVKNFNEKTTYRDSEGIRMNHAFRHPYSKKDMTHPRTKNWHACFGTHSAMGCDGCDHWTLCMQATCPDVKGEFFQGAIVIVEEES